MSGADSKATAAARRRAASARHTRLVAACERLLLSLNCSINRFRSGIARYTHGGRHMVVPYGVPGWPDLDGTIIPTGVRICIECKTGTGRPSEAQRRVMADLAYAGVVVFVVRDAVDAQVAESIRSAVDAVRARWRAANAMEASCEKGTTVHRSGNDLD